MKDKAMEQAVEKIASVIINAYLKATGVPPGMSYTHEILVTLAHKMKKIDNMRKCDINIILDKDSGSATRVQYRVSNKPTPDVYMFMNSCPDLKERIDIASIIDEWWYNQ